ncbi:MAG: glutaminyl-peptide cyclotransferase [Atribacterota bacterium]|nr:glutaminyl-peptide cyclotransferase [Atribacterota bacterium]
MEKRLSGLLIAVVVFFPLVPVFGLEEALRSFLWQSNVPRCDYRVVASYPHDPLAFTQGLFFEEGVLYESTGLYGESSLRKADLLTGTVLTKFNLEDKYFAEGITTWEDKIIQLTWESRLAFVYDKKTLQKLEIRPYPYEGWGITFDGESLIVSDGSEVLRFLDPVDFAEKRKITVRVGEQKIDRLNELEYVEGRIYANVWYEDLILVINPQDGGLLGWIDLASISDQGRGGENVLNGIAFDSRTRTFLITGKRWHRIYRIKIGECYNGSTFP